MPTNLLRGLLVLVLFTLFACQSDNRCIPVEPEDWGRPPLIEVQSDTSCIVGDTLFLRARATDPDGDKITYMVTVLAHDQFDLHCSVDASMDSRTGQFRFFPKAEDVPSRSFLFTAVDERGFSAGTSFEVGVDFLVDQANPAGNGAHNVSYYAPIGQEFVPDSSALDIVQIHLLGSQATDFVVRLRQGTIGGPILGVSDTLTCPYRSQSVATFEFDRVALQPGELYVFEVVQLSPAGWMIETGYDRYPDGRMLLQGRPVNADLWFRLGTSWPPPGAGGEACAIVRGGDR